MIAPPSVSGEPYSVTGTAGQRSNYLRYGLNFTTAYSNNVLGGTSPYPTSDVSYSIWPMIALDKTIPRLHMDFTYSPGFTFYQKTSNENAADQNASIGVQYKLTEHISVGARDTFQKTSSLFNQPDLAMTPVSGTAQAPVVAVVAPLADQLSNLTNAFITYQFGRSSMVGASGSFSYLDYSNPEQVPGLYNSKSISGSAYYNRRVWGRDYVGVTYQHSTFWAYPVGSQIGPQSDTQTNAVSGFFSIYIKPTLSLSFSGGIQHTVATQNPLPATTSWTPITSASFNWRGRHAGFAASYSRIVTSGGGLFGAFDSNNAGGAANWQLTRNWNLTAAANYSTYSTLTPLFLASNSGGHTILGTVSVQRTIGKQLSVQAGYTRMHQSYEDIAAVATFPDTNREFVSINYQFARPLGR